ncbi:retrovirus-related pol polyprotein from transposon TNT 1-94 [Tanacetum coccineum]
MNKNKYLKAKMVSKVEVKTKKSKPVTSCYTPKNEQGQKKNVNVIARGMYRVIRRETQTPVAKSNIFSSNSTRVASSSSVSRSESKDNKLKKRVLLNTKSKSTSKDVKKSQSSVILVSNKRDTLNSNVSKSNADVLKANIVNDVNDGLNLVIQIVLWIVDSGCSKHMTGNLKLLRNFVEKFMGIVCFGNDHFAAITGYGYYVQGNFTICHIYYVEGLGHNLFSGEELLISSRDSNLYTISIFEMAASSPVCLMSKATSTKSWIWHRRLSHLNFVQILKASSDNRTEFKNEKLRSHYEKLGIMHQTLIAQTPQQNGVVERRNQTLLRLPTQCLSFQSHQNSYGLKLFLQLALLKIALLKMKPKADIGIFIGYSESSRGFQIYNRRTRKIMETIHVKFDELTAMASECNNSGPGLNCRILKIHQKT